MNNPFDYIPSEECDKAFAELADRIEILKSSSDPADINFCRELESGKMLGVLIAADPSGRRHTLYAFSGQLGHGGFHHEGFVGPVFDYLHPDGCFKTHEADISLQNKIIDRFERDEYVRIKAEYESIKRSLDAEVEEYREKCRRSKMERAALRKAAMTSGTQANLPSVDENSLIRQSQFEKAELHRLKKRAAATLAPYALRLDHAKDHLNALKSKRRDDSEALQQWLFTNFRLLNALGETRSLSEIFADTTLRIPPSGAGECCAPKLLHAAYLKGWQPISMAEYWYGRPKEGEVRRHGEHYPACRGKCLPVLSWMLRGLDIYPPLNNERQSTDIPEPEILFENQYFCVVDKPGGMLSVPGKGTALSVQQWLEKRYGSERCVKVAHRLDQDTSGLLIATFGELSFKVMQSYFASRMVTKTYIAIVEGDFHSLGKSMKGRITLPLSPDWLDRPRQRVDHDRGKEAVTDYEFISAKDGHSRIMFHPITGRTHQLRVHAASEQGLAMPIVGDPLYGKNGGTGASRLHLHAHKIEFTFPIDRHHYSFELPVPF